MISHSAVHLALWNHLRTLVVKTTGSVTLSATATGYARSSGSFLDDGFSVGLEVQPSGFTQTDPGTITQVTALELKINGGRTVQSAGAGRSLVAGLPSMRARPNVGPFTPITGRPYVEDQYVPATPTLISVPADGGFVEQPGVFVVSHYVPINTGALAAEDTATAIGQLFKSGTSLALTDGWAVRVLDKGPYTGALRPDGDGHAVQVTTVPWFVFHTN